MTYEIVWLDTAVDALARLAKSDTQAPPLIVPVVYELAERPRPSNSAPLGGTQFRRLLLGLYRVTYEITESPPCVTVTLVGRSPTPR